MDEVFVSGYCRAIDSSRTVTAEAYDSQWEADCAWPDCPFAQNCPVAIELNEKTGTA